MRQILLKWVQETGAAAQAMVHPNLANEGGQTWLDKTRAAVALRSQSLVRYPNNLKVHKKVERTTVVLELRVFSLW